MENTLQVLFLNTYLRAQSIILPQSHFTILFLDPCTPIYYTSVLSTPESLFLGLLSFSFTLTYFQC